MRRDGDILLAHVAAATRQLILCAPFIKAAVLRRLLAAMNPDVGVCVVTRWHADEVAAGVSDLETFDIVAARPGSELRLIDRLHAKLYLADDRALVGSANLTATALGWCDRSNLEILLEAGTGDPSIARCVEEAAAARLATAEERDRIASEAASLKVPRSVEATEVDEARATNWMPRLAAPARLYQVYNGLGADRLTAASLEAARHDLEALAILPGLSEPAFRAAVSTSLTTMPVLAAILAAVDGDLGDEDAVAMIAALPGESTMEPELQWVVVRDWMTHFLGDTLEIAPRSYVTRRKPRPMR
ncbi:phospholipase D family protein [Sphingomonas sp. RP10(2022)]|uniref:Phospholipase D n=1 Tax=Sphingomonas liriopis TaxID=2949094 RepID=A0A9X2HUM1_9SPHN|nr:phospholipase D family protein [Sphingomonas liriopis]MCP3733834.1 phospholipase D family protein [Sphingomonas liriopis]